MDLDYYIIYIHKKYIVYVYKKDYKKAKYNINKRYIL